MCFICFVSLHFFAPFHKTSNLFPANTKNRPALNEYKPVCFDGLFRNRILSGSPCTWPMLCSRYLGLCHHIEQYGKDQYQPFDDLLDIHAKSQD